MDEHCFYCFEVLHEALVPDFRPLPDAGDAFVRIGNSETFPLFVTWNISSSGGSRAAKQPRLRGCIGNFKPQPLRDGLRAYAKHSAFDDHRFDPITKDELPRLSCGVSLLVDFEPADDYLDWEIGVHGIWIEFRDEKGVRRTATYLPEVTPEQGWTKDEAIESLLRKGGFRGPITDEVKRAIVLTRYKSKKASASYEDYQRWRKDFVN